MRGGDEGAALGLVQIFAVAVRSEQFARHLCAFTRI